MAAHADASIAAAQSRGNTRPPPEPVIAFEAGRQVRRAMTEGMVQPGAPARPEPARPDLPLRSYIDDRYRSRDYAEALYAGATGLVMRASHRLMERGIDQAQNRDVLEIGGGGMPHLPWMNAPALRRYTVSDRMALHAGTMARLEAECAGRVEVVRHDFDADPQLATLPGGYSRIVASHVLEHVSEPEHALLNWTALLAPQGVMSLALPCDPGWLWRLGQVLGYSRAALGIDFAEYDLVMSREHVTPVQRVLKLARYYFRHARLRWFPAAVPVVDLNLICAITLARADWRGPDALLRR